MKSIRIVLAGALIAIGLSAAEPLTNITVIRMVQAGVPADVVVQTIRSADTFRFSMLPGDLMQLQQAKVPGDVIKAMAARNTGAEQPEAPPHSFVAKAAAAPERFVPTATPVSATRSAAPLPAGGPLLLPDGTPVRLRLNRNLSSADAKTDDTVDFEVLEDVTVGDTLVISRGSTAIGTITDAEKKRRMARGGKLNLEIDYVRLVNGEKAALRAIKDSSGGGHTGAMVGGMVATAIVAWPAAPFFLFMHGKDTAIPKGTEITAYTNGDIRLDSARFVTAPQPVPVQAATPEVAKKAAGPNLTNRDVITLKNAGLGDDVIIAKIRSSAATFNLDVNALLELKKANVSDAVIAAMLQASSK